MKALNFILVCAVLGSLVVVMNKSMNMDGVRPASAASVSGMDTVPAQSQRTYPNNNQCNDIVMYSASWCPYCTRKRSEMNAQNVVFKEYLLDKDVAMNRKIGHKVKGYPTFEINGQIYANYDVSYLLQMSCQ